jgi:DNA-binding CsgD family transcriptional regulator
VHALLTSIAESIRLADGVAGVQVVVAEPPDEAARTIGSAGFAEDPGFRLRLRECRDRGAHLTLFDAPTTLRQRVVPDRRVRMLADPSWAPLHTYLRQIEWRDYATTPIPLPGDHGGVINCYLAPDAVPTPRLMEFFEAMARVAATAVEAATGMADASAARSARQQIALLTPRERDVLRLVASGFSNRDVGSRLGISERTARTHVSNVLAKLEVDSRTQAALLASKAGMGGAGLHAAMPERR